MNRMGRGKESRLWWSGHPYHRTATKLSIVAATGREPEIELAMV